MFADGSGLMGLGQDRARKPMASGIGAKKLLEGVVPVWMIIGTGTLLVLFSAFCFAAAVWRQLFTGAPPQFPISGEFPRSFSWS